ncbi:MAG: translation initiation factor IF-2 [Elusimicrobia bacterium]|nr:translation initiation factor IF-2 [Elusimicrobiota bacterium]
MDKKKRPAKETKEKEPKKTSGKAAPKKMGKSKKPGEKLGIRKHEAEVRSVQEEGSIAPPSKNLVSAFSLFRQTKRSIPSAPVVTRLAPGSSFPKPPAPKPAAPEAPPRNKEGVPAVPVPLPQGQAKTPAAPAKPAVPQAAAPAAPQAPVLPRPAAAPAPRPFVPRPGEPPGGGQRPPPPQARPAAPQGKPAQKAPPPKESSKPAAEAAQSKSALKRLEISSMITVREIAEKMEVKPNDLIKELMALGIFATINQRLETDAAAIVAQEFGYELKVMAMYKEEELESRSSRSEKPENLKSRPPVVTIMGHVDHGKTSLLDAIRSTRVAEGESGGITQHIGAYKVGTPKGDIVFLDTPGHEAFTAMRARGAKVTDIVILVVSATDGVMPQTIEAIDHAKAASVPIIVAVNKIDLPGANPQRIRQELSKHGVMSEEWGGKTIFVDVSAKKRLHLDVLLDMISLQAEMLEIKANPDRPGYGVILEARLDPKRGNVATLLVQVGSVKIGDSFVAGLCYGKIKALIDDTGKRLGAAAPSTPVEILGFMETPQAGDVFSVVSDERQARDIAEKRRLLHREQSFAHQRHMTLVGLKSQVSGPAAKDLNIVLKADVQGSLQALKDSLEGLTGPECRVRIIHSGIGNASESDVLLASASDAVTLLFHADVEPRAQELAQREGVEIRRYQVIYDLIADVKAALEGLLEPEIVDVVAGKGEVREVFSVKGGARIAGCFVREGKVVRGGLARVVRGASVVHEGKISSLKRFKDDVKEVEKGLECGLGFDNFADFQKGDQLEFIVKESRTRRLTQPS